MSITLYSCKKRLIFDHRLKMIGPLYSIVAFASALLLATCNGAGEKSAPVYTTTVSGIVTASPPGESLSINLPGTMVSALTTLADLVNQPVTSRSDGSFTFQVKHSGSFKLKLGNPCCEPFTSTTIKASADGSHDAGVISPTLVAEPAGTARYSITAQSFDPNEYKLTVNCVRAIRDNEFDTDGRIIKTANVSNGIPLLTTITEIVLPPTLKSIGEERSQGP